MSTPRPKKVFISRTTSGLKDTADRVAALLIRRGCEVIHQPDFTALPRDVKGMLVDHLINCDAATCLVGPAHGMLMPQPVKDLGDPRTEDRLFSYTQLAKYKGRMIQLDWIYSCGVSKLLSDSRRQVFLLRHSSRRRLFNVAVLFLVTALLAACGKKPPPEFLALQREYKARAELAGVSVSSRLMSPQATTQELNDAIANFKAESVKVVVNQREILENEVRELREAGLVGPDADIIAGIFDHIATIEALASEKHVMWIDREKSGDPGERLLLGPSFFKEWGRGIMGPGVIAQGHVPEPLEQWPAGLKRHKPARSPERLVTAAGEHFVPGMRFLHWKRFPMLIDRLEKAKELENAKYVEVSLAILKWTSGQNIGPNPDEWRQWWEANKTTEFQIN